MKNMRKIRVLRFTLRHGLEEVEETVNNEIDALSEKGCKVVSIVPSVIQSSPVRVIYNIIYETHM